MWTIRPEQIESLRQASLQRFEDEMVVHMNEFAPRHCKVAGEPGVRQVIRIAIEQGGKYGFTNRGPLRFYTELMFMFGSSFDTDPQHPWASAALTNEENLDQMVRAETLHSRMNEYLAKVSGPKHKYLIEAMRRLVELKMEDFLIPGEGLEQTILGRLPVIYPEKCSYLGEPVLRTLTHHGFKMASEYGLAGDRGRVLMTAFTFSMGHGFAQDPLCNWVRRRLEDPRWTTPDDRIQELYSKSLLFLQRDPALAGGKKN